MLYIQFNSKLAPDKNMRTLCEGFEVHMRENIDLSLWAIHYADRIDNISLDGHELDHLITSFNNIPVNVKKRIVTYRGEMARFILENW